MFHYVFAAKRIPVTGANTHIVYSTQRFNENRSTANGHRSLIKSRVTDCGFIACHQHVVLTWASSSPPSAWAVSWPQPPATDKLDMSLICHPLQFLRHMA